MPKIVMTIEWEGKFPASLMFMELRARAESLGGDVECHADLTQERKDDDED